MSSVPARRTAAALAGLAVIAALGVATQSAAANPPTTIPINTSFTVTLTDLCAFPVTTTGVQTGTARVFTNSSGTPTRAIVHLVEQDTYSAGGATLTGEPYVNQQQLLFDAAGNLIHDYEVGVIARVQLPNGSTFLSAGRLDFTAHPDTAIITPDVGHSGDLAAFCAALAP